MVNQRKLFSQTRYNGHTVYFKGKKNNVAPTQSTNPRQNKAVPRPVVSSPNSQVSGRIYEHWGSYIRKDPKECLQINRPSGNGCRGRTEIIGKGCATHCI